MCDVLILEDDGLTRAAIAELLDQEGLSVETALTPAEALHYLRSHGARVLIADKHLPPPAEIDGFAAAERAMSSHPDLAVIYISVDAQALPEPASEDSRIRALAKPFLPDQLVKSVTEMLGYRGPPAVADASPHADDERRAQQKAADLTTRTNRAAWRALSMIRDAIEELGPVGVLKHREYVGPEFEDEAAELVRGIRQIAAASRGSAAR